MTDLVLLGDRDLGFVTHRELTTLVAGIGGAAHAETEPDATEAVVAPLACRLVGEERMVTAVPGTRVHGWCGGEPFVGFHYCSFGLAEAFVTRLTDHGVVVAARAPDAGVEAVELPGHPFFVATLFQPQVGASRGEPIHPVIRAFLAAAGRTAAV